MKLLEEFRAAVAPPDPHTLAEVRARVLEDGAAPARARRVRRPLTPRGRKAPTWLAPLGAVAAVVAIAVAAAVLVPAGHRSPGKTGSPPASKPVPHAKQFIYTRILQYSYDRQGNEQQRTTTTAWQPVTLAALAPGHNQRGEGYGYTSPCPHGYSCDFSIDPIPHGAAITTYGGAETLPRGTHALLSALAGTEHVLCGRHMPGRTPSQANLEWTGVMSLVQGVQVMPPGFGAALFRAALAIHGVSVVHNVTNAAGVRGIGLSRTEKVAGEPETFIAIFSLHGYQVIGSEQPPVGPPFNSLGMKTALISSKITSKVGPLPPSAVYGGQQFGGCLV